MINIPTFKEFKLNENNDSIFIDLKNMFNTKKDSIDIITSYWTRGQTEVILVNGKLLKKSDSKTFKDVEPDQYYVVIYSHMLGKVDNVFAISKREGKQIESGKEIY